MNKRNRYCINCMNEIDHDEEICPHCGKKIGEYNVNQRALLPMTILDGKYLIGRVLGEGGFGITYLGLDLNLQLKVAIKEYFPIQFASRNAFESNSNDVIVIRGKSEVSFQKGFEKYEKEAKRLVKLEELPGIVRVLNFFYENNTAYMVMDYIQGISLKDYIQEKKRISWKEAVDIIEPVVKSLGILHDNGIIHRDISPDNIMLDSAGRITLIDFGAARELDNGEKSKTIELKHGYAPPEQYQSDGNQGPWTDVYALCATLYYLISGKILPSAMSIYDKNTKVDSLRTYDPTIPKNIEEAIFQGLNVNIKYRFQDMKELYDHLYNGRRIIPWRKIVVAGISIISVLIIMLIMNGIRTIQMNGTEKSDNTSILSEVQQINQTVDEETIKKDEVVKETSSLEIQEDSAANYIINNKLSYTDTSLLEYVEDNGEITITGADSSLTDVVVPEEIDGLKVTSIRGIGTNVTSIILPDTLISIENAAFKNCVYLEYIFIPAKVSSIGSGAFDNCLSLNDIYISNGNEHYYVANGTILDTEGNRYN